MFKKNVRIWSVSLTITLALFSCKKNMTPPPIHTIAENNRKEMTKLIRKLDNPYSVSNMQKAYNNLAKINGGGKIETINIITTHRYIKFKPKSNKELEILKDDSSLILYSYPLDYEISEGSYYHDPLIPDSLPTFQYCSVPVNKQIPKGVEYEILENLFIPDEHSDDPNKGFKLSVSESSIISLVNEALKITGNLESDANSSIGKRPQGSWRPAGRILVGDDVTNTNRGVDGVIVKARRWFTTHEGTADENGFYSCNGTFNNPANYSLDWERYDFALREGWLDGANINGPKIEGDWNLTFQNGDKNAFHAKVFLAAFHYYYKDIKGLRRPPENSFWKAQMHIRCHNEKNDEINGFHSPGRRFLGLGSAVHIYNPQKSIADIYGTVTHELAHASHWNMSKDDYNNGEAIVAESWARGVQWELTRMIWMNYLPTYGRRATSNEPLSFYTGVVQDCIDEDNSPGDGVSGYTIRQIEDALINQRTWNGWRDNILNTYNNATENELFTLFTFWN